MIFRQLTHDDLGCASLPDRRRGRGRRGGRRPAARHRRVPARSPATWACASSTSSRRTTTPTTSPATGGSRRRPARRSTSTARPSPDYDARAVRRRLGARARRAARPRAAHARPPARAHRVRADRHRARRRAVGGADRRLAVRRRHRPARPRRRQARRARAASSARCTTRLLALPDTCEVWPGHLGGSLCGGPGHGPQGRLDDRLRARAPASCWRSTTRTSSSSARSPRSAPQPPNFQAIVALNRGPLRARGRRRASARRRARSSSARAEGALLVDVRTELQFDEAHIAGAVCITDAARRLRLQARLAGAARSAGRARRPRRRRRPRGGRARRRGRR